MIANQTKFRLVKTLIWSDKKERIITSYRRIWLIFKSINTDLMNDKEESGINDCFLNCS